MSLSKTTLQIVGIPASVTNEQLEEQFQDFGPLKRCFVVKKKDAAAKEEDENAVYGGYVEFALAQDAHECMEGTKGKVQVSGTLE